MRSMTGFGRGANSSEDLTVTIELKSVNNRFLDIAMRLPGDLQSLEGPIKKAIGERVMRGRVDVNIQFERSDEVVYELNRPVVEGYLKVFTELKDEYSLGGEPDINVIARLPNVFQTKRSDFNDEFKAAVETALDLALSELDEMRRQEGSGLRDELIARLNEIESRLEPIITETFKVTDEYHARLSKRISEMLAKTDSQIDIDQSRLTQEIAYLADRADISEEIARLKTHIEHFRKIVDEENDVGKRLDFLTQELNREANTITSKTNNMTIKENALSIKSEIEKIREQVQNVE